MKTIVHIELSDEERNDLAKRIYRDPNTKVLATRKEVTETVLALIQQEIQNGREQEAEEPTVAGLPKTAAFVTPEEPETKAAPCEPEPETQVETSPFIPSRGDEDYLAQPKDPGIAAACSRILDDAALIERFAWDTIERNRV